jgi:hypothetical protein
MMSDFDRSHQSSISTYELRINVGFRRVTTRNPCPVCGRKKWCQVTRDGRLAHCMWEARGSIKRAKDDGYIHVLIHEVPFTPTALHRQNTLNHTSTNASELAPLEIRDAAYAKLLELSPAWKYERELITGERGLLARGFSAEEVFRFGALPARAVERDALAQVINELLADELPVYAAQHRGAVVLGVPGFWGGRTGSPRLGRATDYKRPALIIPYRDRQGSIQAIETQTMGSVGLSSQYLSRTSESNSSYAQDRTDVETTRAERTAGALSEQYNAQSGAVTAWNAGANRAAETSASITARAATDSTAMMNEAANTRFVGANHSIETVRQAGMQAAEYHRMSQILSQVTHDMTRRIEEMGQYRF